MGFLFLLMVYFVGRVDDVSVTKKVEPIMIL